MEYNILYVHVAINYYYLTIPLYQNIGLMYTFLFFLQI